MSIPRIYNPTKLQANKTLVLDQEQARYVGRALRLRPGDGLTLFDGYGGEYAAVVELVSKQETRLKIGEHIPRNIESPLSIHLLQGMSKGERMDLVVQKATELGVNRITPVRTDFSVVKLGADRAAKRIIHWSKIAVSACEQCGRNKIPIIDPPQDLKNLFNDSTSNNETCVLLNPGADKTLTSVICPTSKMTLLVGPEGGFSEAEYLQAERNGFSGVTLGPRILRTETAAISAISVLQSLFGDLK